MLTLALPPNLEATREEMRDAKVPLAYRDNCAHLLIPLNRCRFETYYLPWKCEVRISSRISLFCGFGEEHSARAD